MVSVTRAHSLEDVLESKNAKLWLEEQGLAASTVSIIEDAMEWLLQQPAQAELISATDANYTRQGLLIVEILLELHMDDESLLAALLYPYFHSQLHDNKAKEKH